MVDTNTHGGPQGRTSRDEARTEAHDLKEEARAAGQDAYQRASQEAQAQGEAAKGRAADEVGDISSALRRAAEESREGSAQQQAFGRVAESLAEFSDEMRNKSFSEAAHDLDGFARRNPLAFLGGAALLGFAATRFARASSRDEPAAYPHPDERLPADRAPASPAATATPAAPAVNSGSESY
ncbi:hypothetical protein [Histidinibacterium aquaticum]|uniref:Uncharacterized protein n=1 Tax=Histidinibacterium aquaticum TaxID=2613962 RepID=A0A5J5GQF7_9RHOB|nr:hypothetical protein [Histidinibacterium aquaticum]KAA9010481.1 hypothetical protein F3S47_04350 [Histidinibacterium aquaticum]